MLPTPISDNSSRKVALLTGITGQVSHSFLKRHDIIFTLFLLF